MDRRSFLTGALGLPIAGVLPTVSSARAQAQAWPNRTITIVVPFPPGGQSDLAARPIAIALEKILERPVIVDNRQGAAGGIGNSFVAKANPDGYTLVMALSSAVVLPEADRLFDKKPMYEMDQLLPIARVLADPTVIVVHASSPWKTLGDLIDDAKQRPGAITYSSSGAYGATHVPMEMFTQATGIAFRHIPYRGGGPALTAMLAKQVDTLAAAPGVVAPHVESGAARVLASWANARTKELPNVPTFKELGFADVEFYIWAGLFAPKNTPELIVARLRAAMRQAMQNSQITSVFEKAGSPPAYLDQPEFIRFIAADSARLIPAVKKIGKVE
jgi:tripartite-type tricarboxylate transporter receptor subunit TctC